MHSFNEYDRRKSLLIEITEDSIFNLSSPFSQSYSIIGKTIIHHERYTYSINSEIINGDVQYFLVFNNNIYGITIGSMTHVYDDRSSADYITFSPVNTNFFFGAEDPSFVRVHDTKKIISEVAKHRADSIRNNHYSGEWILLTDTIHFEFVDSIKFYFHSMNEIEIVQNDTSSIYSINIKEFHLYFNKWERYLLFYRKPQRENESRIYFEDKMVEGIKRKLLIIKPLNDTFFGYKNPIFMRTTQR